MYSKEVEFFLGPGTNVLEGDDYSKEDAVVHVVEPTGSPHLERERY